MAEYALVENGQITELAGQLPDSWRNVSGLQAMKDDAQFLASLGWIKITKQDVTINPHTEELGPPRYTLQQDGSVVQEHDVLSRGQEQAPVLPELTWADIRARRDILMSAMSYRYERYSRNERLGLPQIDDLSLMDQYMKELADVTTTYDEPSHVSWPTYVLQAYK